MKAILQNGYGAPATALRYGETATPTPGPDDVLVETRAASVNARDWHIMRGDPYIARLTTSDMPLRGPRNRVLGTDFAGRVVAVGADVTGIAVGDDVYGEVNGAFAEYVCAPQDVVGLMPSNVNYEQAAAVPLAGNTALVCLLDEARIQPGQRLLVNGASGGVGTFAVQVGKALAAEVTAVCSPRNVDLVTSLGADHVVDYTKRDFTERRYDVVFDLVGNRSLKELRRCLADDGTIILSGGGVSTGGSLVGPMALFVRGALAAKFGRTRIIAPQPKPTRDRFDALTKLIEAGTVAPVIDRSYPLDEAPAAIRYLEEEHARAKVVLLASR
ncbi:NAD(P)-dependent alcohol dehydrogenase [Virgisporangium aurantiacum]|uniref:NADPH:quinone reductase n=1 Tax=Virgisporangium aurantiacum TaxID=175570 RepID=A0A8J3Z4Z4_9ACTN|nr:NAD(P)-dependent alcohol dehydrogenase [Virgisporangium aurantiacum]GIJ55040.1 NADPH:quinone reductase [Virgisporangium aurantiacum]